jgi:hypothetical protein
MRTRARGRSSSSDVKATKSAEDSAMSSANQQENPSSNDELLVLRGKSRRAVFRVLLPFFLALVLGLAFRVYMTHRASDTLAEIAVTIKPNWVEKDGESVPVFPTISLPDPDAALDLGYRERLVKSLQGRWRNREMSYTDDRSVLRDEIFFALMSESLTGVMLLQSIGLLFFPSLFATLFFQAASGIAEFSRNLRRGQSFSFEDRIDADRNRYWLEEEAKPWFWRRFTFGMILVFAINFFSSPAGMQASIIGDYIALRPSLGESSHPFAFGAFADAPPYVVGFAGYYLYCLTATTGRFMAGSLSHRILPSLINRGITVMILSLVIASITQGDSMSRAIVFLVGVFPELGVKYLSKISQAVVGAAPNSESSGFVALPEIDMGKQAALSEVGVSSMQELAVADWKHLVERVGISPRLLMRSADRALLFYTLGVERGQKLAALGIFGACDLVLYVRGEDAYRWRWEAANMPLPRNQVEKLAPEVQEARLKKVEKSAECEDLALVIDSLMRDRNISFYIDNRISYGTI